MRGLIKFLQLLTTPLRVIGRGIGTPFRLLGRALARSSGAAAAQSSATARYAQGRSTGAAKAAASYMGSQMAALDASASAARAPHATPPPEDQSAGASGPTPASPGASGESSASDTTADRAQTPPPSDGAAPPRPTKLTSDDTQRSLLFRIVPTFSLIHKASSGYTLNDAGREYAYAAAFFDKEFELFPNEEIFYETAEEKFLKSALNPFASTPQTKDVLGLNAETGRPRFEKKELKDSIDGNFLENMKNFQDTVDWNSKRLLLIVTPLIIIISMVLAIGALFAGPIGNLSELTSEIILMSGVALATWSTITFVYYVSYTNQQRYNAMALRAYISDKFNRIQQNILRVKDTLIQLHLNKTLRDEKNVREETRVWIGTLQWLITRITFCEFMIRNSVFRIWRDALLMHLVGQLLCFIALILLLVCAPFIAYATGSGEPLLFEILKISVFGVIVTLVAYWGIMPRPMQLVITLLESNSWTRLHEIKVLDILTEIVAVDKWEIIRTRSKQLYGGGDSD